MTCERNTRVRVGSVKQLLKKCFHEKVGSTLLLLLLVLGMQGCIAAVAIVAATTGSEGGSHTATVEVEKTPQAVYVATLRIVNESPDIKLESRDDAKYIVKASRGKNRIEARAELMDNGMTELTVKASVGEKGQTHESLALRAVKRVCDELGVPYRVVKSKKK